MMDFVIQSASKNNPPGADLPTKAAIENHFRKLSIRDTFKHFSTTSARLLQFVKHTQILVVTRHLHKTWLANDRFQVFCSQHFEKPVVGVNQVLSQIREAHGFYREAPVCAPFRNKPESFQSGFSDRYGKLRESLTF